MAGTTRRARSAAARDVGETGRDWDVDPSVRSSDWQAG